MILDPLPVGALDRLDLDRAARMVREAALAQHPRERGEWLAALDAGAPIHVDLFDQDGFARIGFGRSDGAIVVVGRVHWRSFLPEVDGVWCSLE